MNKLLTKAQALQKLERQRVEIEHLLRQPRNSSDFNYWKRNTEVAIENSFGSDGRHIKDFKSLRYSLIMYTSETPESSRDRAYKDGLKGAQQLLRSMLLEIEEYWDDSVPAAVPPFDAIASIEKICHRFHFVARQLRQRHADRATLDINDEYDVQDLLHALLQISFDDIRAEEWTPSYAGGSSRVDFLLKDESIIIEVKKTRGKLGAREIGNELIIDIARYQAHPNCKTLICFVYDPEARVANPRGLEADLNKKINELEVKVFVRPTGA